MTLLLRADEAAELLGLSVSQVRAWTRAGIIPCLRNGRAVMYGRAALEAWASGYDGPDGAARRWDDHAAEGRTPPGVDHDPGTKQDNLRDAATRANLYVRVRRGAERRECRAWPSLPQ